jgi:hypothetical protein
LARGGVGPVDIVPKLFTIQNTHTVLKAPITHQPFTAGTQANMTPTEDHEESEPEDSDKGQGETAQVMEDDEEDEPFLQRETASDVALDMDVEDYPEDQEASEDSDDEGDGRFGAGEWNADDKIDLEIIFQFTQLDHYCFI